MCIRDSTHTHIHTQSARAASSFKWFLLIYTNKNKTIFSSQSEKRASVFQIFFLITHTESFEYIHPIYMYYLEERREREREDACALPSATEREKGIMLVSKFSLHVFPLTYPKSLPCHYTANEAKRSRVPATVAIPSRLLLERKQSQSSERFFRSSPQP